MLSPGVSSAIKSLKMPSNPLRYSQKLPITTPAPPPPPAPSSSHDSMSSGTDNRVKAISFTQLNSHDSDHPNDLTDPLKNGYSIQLDDSSISKPSKQWWKSNLTKLVGSFLVGIFCISIVVAAVLIRVQVSDSNQVAESRSNRDVNINQLSKRSPDNMAGNNKTAASHPNTSNANRPIDNNALVIRDDNLENISQNVLRNSNLETKPIQVPIHVIFDPLPNSVAHTTAQSNLAIPTTATANSDSRNNRNTPQLPSTSTNNKVSISPQVFYETENSGNLQSSNLQIETKDKTQEPTENSNNNNNNDNNKQDKPENMNNIFETVVKALQSEDGGNNLLDEYSNNNHDNNLGRNPTSATNNQQQPQQQVSSNSVITTSDNSGDNAKNGKYVIHMDIKIRKQK